jgi:hypothetical protein
MNKPGLFAPHAGKHPQNSPPFPEKLQIPLILQIPGTLQINDTLRVRKLRQNS